jgi:uncharacterized repeat protein (TIGR03803 family)
MRIRLENSIVLAWMVMLLPAAPAVQAQTFTTLHSFTNGDGANPVAGLILSGNTLFGTTENGGASGKGTVFAVNTDGTGFTNLHHFTTSTNDGANPEGVLLLLGNTLYGTTTYGGSNGFGTVFALNTDGTGYTNLHLFAGHGYGSAPYAGLMFSGNTLYGTTQYGGSGGGNGGSTVFAINPDGTGFTNLHSLVSIEGAEVLAGLVLMGNSLFGTAWQGGGLNNAGTVFTLNPDGTGFTNLHTFTRLDGLGHNGDGFGPQAGLVGTDNTVYGTTYEGGLQGNGTVFAVNLDGSGFTNLHSFSVSDGTAPDTAPLLLSGQALYGTTDSGGSFGHGTVFAINTDGTGFLKLHDFAGSDGASPIAGLILTNNTLYGTALIGGSSNVGTVFSLSFRPRLTIDVAGTNVILLWPANFAGFDFAGYTLQATTNLTSPVWTTNFPATVLINGNYTVTNPISVTRQFFRLSQ